ncbi:hypothetical protein P298_00505 [Salmonella enterica subsp. arizonae serovar 18:z4,z23:- str. CVM N26626]|uniref:Uncharacterized protein n=1 Tax=Salmonella enterica subsp. arizonae serovar 18:z4,z23:- str. CVM N26626 TaxID=1395119 RepID=A0A3S5YJK3_SALER|nr:hypothetical protein P297_08005 [Salmonella enterica subsp. arizonae serovar 18:z4,z23:- str. CVM N26625]OLV99075.1 hypothetical protein P298_00505 [Salmonella enterica subsp. arizonae serovar 18:z4,z23:- str. CVM N26626]OLW36521.1 hypothetical protein P286_12890 [Salmonella enterica subsp. arizonae serovar 18:z4,z23:- str. CVM N4410]OLY39216.1 hypothetical protein P282_00970 [Salmonella enterica subsp. arizonae serovar 18:z4,z23:- str. CVM 32457]
MSIEGISLSAAYLVTGFKVGYRLVSIDYPNIWFDFY